MKKILIIEDEFSIKDILSYTLSNENYEVLSLSKGCKAIEYATDFNPDLILLDLMLPDISGFELCKSLSLRYPIIILTAKNDMSDKLKGLELGADDYITKPFDIREVLLRVKALLKRTCEIKSQNIHETSGLVIDRQARCVYVNAKEIKLKPKEFDLLLFLHDNKNIVFSREDLLDKVWDYNFEGELRTVDVHVRRLRSKLDYDKKKSIIETVFGVGYVMR